MNSFTSKPEKQPIRGFATIQKQLITITPTLLISTAVALGGSVLTVLIAEMTDNPIWKLAKDPSEVMNFPSYIGMLSNWGVLLWMTAAAICLFTAMIMRRSGDSSQARQFIFTSGILSLILAVDDLYRLHDWLLPRMLHISEFFFYLLYLVLIAGYLFLSLRQIHRYEYILFWISTSLLAISRRMFLPIPFLNAYMTTGDMLKYFGIVFWLAFFYRTASHEISSLIQQPKPGATP
jgi:hypothetical protein